MHSGHPYFAETYGILQAYPNVYTDVAYINYYLPRAEFHRYLKSLIDAVPGVDKRIMFGTDVYLWKEGIKPAAIPLNVKVVLVGEPKLYDVLRSADPDFAKMFKVKVEFDEVMPFTTDGLQNFLSVVKRIITQGKLPPFDRAFSAFIEDLSSRGLLDETLVYVFSDF